jgi:hypothetical protein
LDSRAAVLDKAEEEFKKRVEEMQIWYAECLQDLQECHTQLAKAME